MAVSSSAVRSPRERSERSVRVAKAKSRSMKRRRGDGASIMERGVEGRGAVEEEPAAAAAEAEMNQKE